MKEDSLQLNQLQSLFEKEKEKMLAILETLSNENKVLRMQLGKTESMMQKVRFSEQDTLKMVQEYSDQVKELNENIRIIDEKRES